LGQTTPTLQKGFPGRPCPYSNAMHLNSPALARSKIVASSDGIDAFSEFGLSQ
jgi:hypothetical protein